MKLVCSDFGHCNYSIEDNYVHIYNLFVHPDFRGQGKARDLLKRAIDEIRGSGWSGTIKIVSDPKDEFVDRSRLKKFYESMGLEVFTHYA